MNATIKNIINANFRSFTDCKWDSIVASDSDQVLGQLDKYTEI